MAADETAFLVDLASGDASPLPELTLQSIGFRERADLQRWLLAHPELVGPDLLVVTSEFDRWEIREQRVSDRLDVLYLDKSGALVVAELKRDQAVDTIDLQALKYAAYCSQLTVSDVVDEFARFHALTPDEARSRVASHAPSLAEDGEIANIRIRLVAGGFGPAVTTTVLWLREFDLDIGCIQITARGSDGRSAILSSRQILPLPQAEDYLVRRRRREQEEKATRETNRGLNSVRVLADAGVLEPGYTLALGLDTLTAKWRAAIEPFVESDPSIGRATWTGEVTARSLRWEHDHAVYSPTGLTKRILLLAGLDIASVAGPDHWLLPDGRPMYRAALEIRAEHD